tara:strand:+ start:325 stop:480 length:156 start_codon:yes stop_codon:yes gene_type:complete
MNRIQSMIELQYPGRLSEIEELIEVMKLDYDSDMFLEEDIEESILMELNII